MQKTLGKVALSPTTLHAPAHNKLPEPVNNQFNFTNQRGSTTHA